MQPIYDWIRQQYDQTAIPALMDFIRIQNTSRNFDPSWLTDGLNAKACQFAMDWAGKQGLQNFSCGMLSEENRTPAVLATIDAKDKPTVLIYGHLDKQPPLADQWSDGRKPYEPVIQDGKLYGRGSDDDGYAFFTAVLVLKAVQQFNLPCSRIVLLFETDEESGSKDLLYYLEKNKEAIGEPKLVICLDSGCCDYDHLCQNSTLRGIINFNLKVGVLSHGVHSGEASGICPDSFRVARKMLETLESADTGILLLKELYTNIPDSKYQQAQELIKEKGGKIDWEFPFLPDVRPTTEDGFKQYINRTWMPELTVIGIDGVPPLVQAGNVLRPYTTLELSIRLSPNLEQEKAKALVLDFFGKLPKPYNAVVELEIKSLGQGFDGPDLSPNVKKMTEEAALEVFGKPLLYYGSGGSIPFMNELREVFPAADFLITGVSGPKSNAHGGDECLDIEFAKKLSCCLAKILSQFK